jgi:AraC-like DNA-binding protein
MTQTEYLMALSIHLDPGALEGVSVKGSQVFDQLRSVLAVKYLTSSDFTIDDIAMLLGFSDESNFRKSFRRWTGKNPNEYRGCL